MRRGDIGICYRRDLECRHSERWIKARLELGNRNISSLWRGWTIFIEQFSLPWTEAPGRQYLIKQQPILAILLLIISSSWVWALTCCADPTHPLIRKPLSSHDDTFMAGIPSRSFSCVCRRPRAHCLVHICQLKLKQETLMRALKVFKGFAASRQTGYSGHLIPSVI